jgi:hypothetical protein
MLRFDDALLDSRGSRGFNTALEGPSRMRKRGTFKSFETHHAIAFGFRCL